MSLAMNWPVEYATRQMLSLNLWNAFGPRHIQLVAMQYVALQSNRLSVCAAQAAQCYVLNDLGYLEELYLVDLK